MKSCGDLEMRETLLITSTYENPRITFVPTFEASTL